MRVISSVVLGLLLAGPLCAATSVVAIAQTKTQASAAETDFRHWMAGLGQSGIEAKVGGLAFDAASDTLTAEDLTLTSAVADAARGGSGQVRVGTISIASFSVTADGYSFASARADDLSIGVVGENPGTIKIQRINVGKSFLPKLTGFAPDPKRPVTSQVKLLSVLSKARVESVDLSDISIGSDLAVKSLGLRTIGAGTIALLSVGDLSSSWRSPTAEGAEQVRQMSLKEATVKNISIASYVQLFDESSYLSAGAARPWTNLVESADLKGLAISDGPISLSAETAALGALKVRQFPENITAIFDNAASNPAYLQSNPPEAQKLATSVRQAFNLESARLSGFKLAAPNKDGVANVSVGSAVLANVSSSHIDKIVVSSASLSDPGGVIGLRSLEFANINMPLDGDRPTAEAGAANLGGKAIVPTVGKVSAEGLDVRVGDVAFGLDKLQVAMSYFVGPTPTNLKATLDHLKFSVAQVANPGLRQTLTDLGYQNVDLSVDVSGAWQDSASALAFDAVKITGAEMGVLTLSGSLTGVTRESIEDPAGTIGREVMAGGLQNFRLSFENGSLFDRFIAQAAKVNSKTPEELKSLLSSNMPAIMAKISVPAIRNKFIFAAVSFLNTPRNLDLVASTSDVTPIKDVVAALQNPADLPVVLKLDASANDRK